MFPVVLLLIFATVFGGKTIDVDGGIEIDRPTTCRRSSPSR